MPRIHSHTRFIHTELCRECPTVTMYFGTHSQHMDRPAVVLVSLRVTFSHPQYLFLFFVSSFIVNCNDLKIHDGPQNKHFYSKTFFLSTKENPHFTQLTNLPIKTICRTSILDLKRYFPTCIQTMFMDTAHKEREIRVGKIVL